MGRRSKDEIDRIRQIILAISKDMPIKKADGNFETSKIVNILKEQYDLSISRPTLLEILKEGNYSVGVSSDNVPTDLKKDIKWIDDEIDRWRKDYEEASIRERLRISKRITELISEKNQLVASYRESMIAKYVVKFGEPQVIKIDNDKEPFFKTGNGQVSIKDCGKKEQEGEDKNASDS